MKIKRIMGSGMTRLEILHHSDEIRQQVFDHICVTGYGTVGNLARLFNITRDQTRSHLRNLLATKTIEMINPRGKGFTSDAYYIPTGRHYYPPDREAKVEQAPKNIIPGARQIRLLDKKPTPMTPQERRRLQSNRGHVYGVRGSSMSMFEVF